MYVYTFDELYNASNNEDFEFVGMNMPEVKQSLVNFKTEDLHFLKQNIKNNMNSDLYSSYVNVISIIDTINSIIDGREKLAPSLSGTGNSKKDKILEILNDVEVSGIKNIEKLNEVIKIIKSL